MEHHANIVPWQMLCERKGAVLKVLPFNDKGELDLSQLDTLLTPRVKLVGVAYVSNVLGTVNPVKELIGRALGSVQKCWSTAHKLFSIYR